MSEDRKTTFDKIDYILPSQCNKYLCCIFNATQEVVLECSRNNQINRNRVLTKLTV